MVRRTKRHRIRLWALFRLMMMTALFVAATGGPRGGQGLFWGSASGFVIAPPWANEATNPCSRESWQLIYWPPDGSCHQIFDRGPCPETQELAFNDLSLVAECRCPKGLLYWPETDRCYEEFSRGPCQANQYLVRKQEEVLLEGLRGQGVDLQHEVDRLEPLRSSLDGRYNHLPASRMDRSMSDDVGLPSGPESTNCTCKDTKVCLQGWAFWPQQQECYQLFTQGPCHKGDLLILNPVTSEPVCGCDPDLLRPYFFPALRLCYEHNTKGPCESGLLFAYDRTTEAPQCTCDPSLANYHAPSAQCFQFGTVGPCEKGQVFSLGEGGAGGPGECRCKDGYVLWRENGACYKAFTVGPCGTDNGIIVPYGPDLSVGVCSDNPCPPRASYLIFPDLERLAAAGQGLGFSSSGGDPEDGALTRDHCFKVGSRGPCPQGELVVFERYSGKSYLGECGCSAGYNQNYWPETSQCFEWYSQGPCPDTFMFAYNEDTGRTECVCDEEQGFIYWNASRHHLGPGGESGLLAPRCYQVHTRGPCPEHALLVPSEDRSEVFCECGPGFRLDGPPEAPHHCLREAILPDPGGHLEQRQQLGFLEHLFPRLWQNNQHLLSLRANLERHLMSDESSRWPTLDIFVPRNGFLTEPLEEDYREDDESEKVGEEAFDPPEFAATEDTWWRTPASERINENFWMGRVSSPRHTKSTPPNQPSPLTDHVDTGMGQPSGLVQGALGLEDFRDQLGRPEGHLFPDLNTLQNRHEMGANSSADGLGDLGVMNQTVAIEHPKQPSASNDEPHPRRSMGYWARTRLHPSTGGGTAGLPGGLPPPVPPPADAGDPAPQNPSQHPVKSFRSRAVRRKGRVGTDGRMATIQHHRLKRWRGSRAMQLRPRVVG